VKKILVIGATSAIAEATARIWAQRGHRFYLIARNEERLNAIAADLKIRGAESTQSKVLDLDHVAQHEAAIDAAIRAMEGIDIVLIAHGTLGDQGACEKDFGLTLQEINTNALSVMSLLTHLANRFERQQHGTIAVVGSVAGDRGRQSNYVYGAAKGAVAIFLQGLRQRLHKSGVHVLTVKPGFVDTPMTAKFRKGFLWAAPEAIGARIARAVEDGADVIYAPGFWRLIMTLIKLTPEALFKRTTT
jgi:decaprenylphospho-beta-D-erythro-pentofuranosid-2-ulose 2-reductase